jgi:hypothetical protein
MSYRVQQGLAGNYEFSSLPADKTAAKFGKLPVTLRIDNTLLVQSAHYSCMRNPYMHQGKLSALSRVRMKAWRRTVAVKIPVQG